MNCARAVLLLVLALFSLGSRGADGGDPDFSMLYDDVELRQLQERYTRTGNRIFHELILPVLFSREKQQLRSVELRFPLHNEGVSRQSPLQAYAMGHSVTTPVASLKFLEDLSLAVAWLQENDYSLETVGEYIAILRHRKFQKSGLPKPLQALKIPSNARSNKEVNVQAAGHFVTARTFVLLHELGHIVNPSGSAIAREARADKFAIDVMKRTVLPPYGILVFFLYDAHWSDYPAPANATHPLSGDRLRALAAELDDPGLAENIGRLGQLMDDRETRAALAATGLAGDVESLIPRKRKQVAFSQGGGLGVAGNQPFVGRYVGQSTQAGTAEPFRIETELLRRGDSVSGRYSFGLGWGTLMGTVEGDNLYFRWEWAGNHGGGIFRAKDSGAAFSGTWGYLDSRDNAGSWEGRREK